jgi:hypothetical protein
MEGISRVEKAVKTAFNITASYRLSKLPYKAIMLSGEATRLFLVACRSR